MGNQVSLDGQVWVCQACGKRSRDKYGDHAINPGWDVSCMLHSILVHEDKCVLDEHGRVKEIQEGGLIEVS
jgi:hypothetical protein